MYRSCLCNDIKTKENEEVTLAGWIDTIRDHGSLAFIHLRDHSGIAQIVIEEFKEKFHMESVVKIKGKVRKRPSDQINNILPTGEYEVLSERIELLSSCDYLPFRPSEEITSDYLKIQHRPLYLRGQGKKELLLRGELFSYSRKIMESLGFMEVSTPILSCYTKGGAKNFLVPSTYKGLFFALPQSPQIYKQLLMVSSLPKYYQLAPCFRREDSRSDRCFGEFYQLDFEMSFIEQEEVLNILKEITNKIFSKFSDKKINWNRISYKESIEKYGTDKPDLRNPLFIEDFTDEFKRSDFNQFKNLISLGSVVKGIRYKGNTTIGQREEIIKIAEENNFKTGYCAIYNGKKVGPISKYISDSIFSSEEEIIFFVCEEEKKALYNCHILREKIGESFNLLKDSWEMLLVVDFPMFEKTEEGWQFLHNPFSLPQSRDFSDLENVLAYQYDVVCNGYELASGAIRNHDYRLLIEVFKICGYSEETMKDLFKSMINGLRYGAPPHGGAAFGLERILMLLSNTSNIRDVVPFPINSSGHDPLTGAPHKVDNKELEELGLKITIDK